MTEVDDIQRDFKTSRRFGIVGVVVVMVVVAALALAFGSNNAHPTVLMAVIFAIVFGFVAVLMFLQRRDLSGAEARSTRAAVAAAGPVTDPTTADANTLIHDLAIKPVDDAAIAESTSRMWSITRSSMNSAIPLMVLIACAVIPWQLFTAYWSLYIFVPIIVLYVGYLAIRVIMPGGTLDQAYDSSAPMLDALGLAQVERPQIGIQPRIARPGLQKRVSGEIEYAGTRHGRQVTVQIPAEGGTTTTTLSGSFEKLHAAVKGERLVARPGAPTAVNAVLDPLRPSSYWKGVAVTAGPDGLVVERKRDGGQHWMRDLWLAERLADALASRA
jgi:hypothetical protein